MIDTNISDVCNYTLLNSKYLHYVYSLSLLFVMQYPTKVIYDTFLYAEKAFYLRNLNESNHKGAELRLPAKNAKGNSEYFEKFAAHIQESIGYAITPELLQRRRREVEDDFIKGEKYFSFEEDIFNKLYEYAFNEVYSTEKDHYQRYINKEHRNKPQTQHIDTAKHHFFALIEHKLKPKLANSGKVETPDSFFSKEVGIPVSDVKKFLVAVPTTLFSQLTGQALNFKFRNISQLISLTVSESVLLCHALSIHSDSLFLLSDIGRFARFARIFKPDVSPQVFLTGVDFGKLNWVVQKYKDVVEGKNYEIDIDDTLRSCFEFRKKLYERMQFKVVVCDWLNLDSNKYFEQLNSTTISTRSDGYSNLMKIVMGKYGESLSEKLTASQTKDAIKQINDFIPKMTASGNKENILKFKFVQNDLRKHLNVIKMVVNNFNSYSEETFRYFLLQYYHQFKFDRHLKLAIDRESIFDNTFHELKNTEEDSLANAYELFGLYFKDYECIWNGKEHTVHPYYFPSGTLHQNCKTLSEAESAVILIKDGLPKIRNVINSYGTKIQLSALMSDVFSFAYFFFYNKPNSSKSFDREFKIIASSLGTDFIASWEAFTAYPDNFDYLLNQFQENLITFYGKETIIPFWYYPYIFTFNEFKEIELVEVYSSIINLILREMEKELGFGHELNHWSLPVAEEYID